MAMLNNQMVNVKCLVHHHHHHFPKLSNTIMLNVMLMFWLNVNVMVRC
jgi:hypothetical protein